MKIVDTYDFVQEFIYDEDKCDYSGHKVLKVDTMQDERKLDHVLSVWGNFTLEQLEERLK